MSKTIKLDSKGRFPLKDLEGLVDIDRVEFYTVKYNKNNTITLKLYDKKRKLIKPNAS